MPSELPTEALLRLRLLSEAAQDLLAADDPDDMLQGLFRRARSQLPVDVYFNFMVDPDAKALHLASCGGVSASVARDLARLDFGQAVCGTVAATGEPLYPTDIQRSDDPLTDLVRGLGIRAYACNPLRIGERVLGTLSFGSRSVDRFAEEDLELFRAICRCVTFAYERLRSEVGLRHSEQALRESRSQLLEQMQRLEEQDRRKDDFLAILGHELRNPLAGLRSGVDVLLDGQDAAEWAATVERLDAQVDHLGRLVDELLDVTRISRGKIELRKQVCGLRRIVERSADCVRRSLEEKGLALELALPDSLHVEVDPDRLEQVVTNLLDNAIAHAPEGSAIRIVGEEQAPWVTLRVRDRGPGVSPELRERIFEAFSQGPATRRGLGLGLAVVRQLVALHGGEVWIDGDAGSEFAFRIPGPVAGDAASTSDGAPVAEATSSPTSGFVGSEGPPRRVLIVDDNRDAALSLAMLLRRRHCTVEIRHAGTEVRQAALDQLPEVVLLDLGLPDVDGFEVAQALRGEPALRHTRIVALTGFGDPRTARRVAEGPFDDLILKPAAIGSILAQMGHRSRAGGTLSRRDGRAARAGAPKELKAPQA